MNSEQNLFYTFKNVQFTINSFELTLKVFLKKVLYIVKYCNQAKYLKKIACEQNKVNFIEENINIK